MGGNIILWMSLSGSAVVLLYCAVCAITRKTLSVKLRYNLLRVAVLFFLLPLPAVKYLFSETLRNISTFSLRAGQPGYSFIESSVIYNRHQLVINPAVRFGFVCIAVSGVCAAVFSLIHIVSYFRTKWLYRRNCTEFKVYEYFDDYGELRRDLELSRNIHFVFSPYCSAPMTIGVFTPVVVLPEAAKEYGKEEWGFILRHELVHIKSYDLLLKFLGLAVISVHWFNPISYILFHELCNLCEIHCDDKTVSAYNKETRQRYCGCIINMATGSGERKYKAASVGMLGDDARTIKRRVLEIRELKRKKRIWTTFVSAAVALAGGTSVLAFDPVTEIELAHDLSPDSGYIVCDDMDHYADFHSGSGDVFVDMESGYRLSNINMALCKHNFTSTTLGEHTRNADGSCDTIFYDSERCTKCGKILEKEYAGDTHLKKCPHE